MAFQIRDCLKEDLIGVTQIENSSFDEPYPYRLFVALLNDFPGGFRVAISESGIIIGYCILSYFNKRGSMMISSIAVDPDFRKEGAGFELLKDAIRIAKSVSSSDAIYKIELQVATSNTAALSLYKKFGFRFVREMQDYYGLGKDAMQLELRLDGE